MSVHIETSSEQPGLFCVETYVDGRLVMVENLSAAEASRRWIAAKAENDRREVRS